MPALVAIRFNPPLKAKPGTPGGWNVAIMRKLLILANALLQDGRKWPLGLA